MVLEVRGIEVDTIDICAPSLTKRLDRAGPGDAVVAQWKSLALQRGHTELQFWLTLTIGRMNRIKLPQPREWELFVESLRTWIVSGTADWPSNVMVQVFARIHTVHQFFTTKKGLIGIGDYEAKPGDKVCVLFGGAVPLVLREDSDGDHRIVNDCYIHSIAKGQAIDDFEAGKYQEQVFRLV
jgi:hypothetical protein